MRATDAALLIVSLVIAWSFYRAHNSNTGRFAEFNLLDLLIENGRVSRLAVAFMATLVVSSWVVIKLTIENKLSDVIFGGYLTAWVAPIIAKLFSSQTPAQPPAPTPPATP